MFQREAVVENLFTFIYELESVSVFEAPRLIGRRQGFYIKRPEGYGRSVCDRD